MTAATFDFSPATVERIAARVSTAGPGEFADVMARELLVFAGRCAEAGATVDQAYEAVKLLAAAVQEKLALTGSVAAVPSPSPSKH